MSNGKQKHSGQKPEITDNNHQKTVQGKNQDGPSDKVGKDAGGNRGSQGQNRRARSGSVGSHKPGGDGPGTKTFKHDSDDNKRTGR